MSSGAALSAPVDLKFGPSGDLFVTNIGNSTVTRYNGITGAYLGVFIDSLAGGLNGPYGLVFGPDGNLYVANYRGGIRRFSGSTGAFIDQFIAPGAGGPCDLRGPAFLVFSTSSSGANPPVNGCPSTDSTPPVIVPTVTGTAGANGWYTSGVTVSWSFTDPESGIASSTGCGPTTLTANTTGTMLTCSATNGDGLTTSVPVMVKIDQTPPAIAPTITGPLGANGWYTGNVTVSWSVTDPESGIASSSGCGSTTLATGTTLTCSAPNGAGLSSSAPVMVKIDNTLPVISGLPATGCTLWPPNHKMVNVGTITAADAPSGLAPGSFTVTGTSNEPSDPKDPDIVITANGSGGFVVQLRADRLGTGTGRIYSLTSKATDLAGNQITATTTCTVPHDQGK